MPAPSINTSFNNSIRDILLLENYVHNCRGLDPKYQYMVSEVVMLRLFSIIESTIEEFALKLACGAKYKNGNSPVLLRRCNSLSNAHINMLNFNRRRSKPYLKWTRADFIEESIKYVLDINDVFYRNILIHANIINEMRIVRNHVAHRSTDTKNEYLAVLRSKYGANINLPLGVYLMSTARNPISNIMYYIQATRIILHDISNG